MMELFGHLLSSKAVSFLTYYLPQLDKEVKYAQLDDTYPQWGALDNRDDCYVIGIKPSMPMFAFDATLCHEIYHAFQFSNKFPTVISTSPNANDVKEFVERLRSNILDLSADDAVRTFGLDDSFVMKKRYKYLKQNLDNHAVIFNTPYAKDLLAIDLILDFHSMTNNQLSFITDLLKHDLSDVYWQYAAYKAVIEKGNYNTPLSCFNIFGYIINKIGLWGNCVILYNGQSITSKSTFRRCSTFL